MLLPQTKEREYRFKLALRMGLPIFALVLALITHTFISNQENLNTSFYIEAILLLAVSIYFIFYLIYNGFRVKITDPVTKTFSREYLYDYLKKEIKKEKEYSLILVSIDNLSDINSMYGIKNGDKTLEVVATWIGSYLENEKIINFPLGHIKGGDFIVGLSGFKSNYSTLLELMCLKSSEFKVNDIEVTISGAIIDTTYSKDINHMIEKLFELQEKKRNSKIKYTDEVINPNDLELMIIQAIDKRNLQIMTQDVFEGSTVAFQECFVKLIGKDEKLLHPKTYMKVIKKLGLSVEFDSIIVEKILQNARQDKKYLYAINISPSSLRNEKFLAQIKELIKDKENIELMFVLSEQEYYSHTSRYNSILKSLRQYGIKIAIDRLGSLHTSFLYLRELEIDVIRFDNYYSNNIKLIQNSSIVDGFNIMAHEKGIKSWIKNIEEEETLQLVKNLKIDYLQGKEISDLKNFA
jgi:EAL domain-containing protein (putative c-di-GMP-specific phosphodiesterase class I)/GGDEF domain-containing protein